MWIDANVGHLAVCPHGSVLGEFEAEIGPAQVDEVRQKVEEAAPAQLESPGAEVEATHSRRVSKAEEELRGILDYDPTLALAKLRIEIERDLAEILAIKGDSGVPPRPRGVVGMMNSLLRIGVIDKPTADATRTIVAVLNQAVHGARIEPDEAAEVIDAGIRLLDRLSDIYLHVYEEAFQPVEEETLDMMDHESAQTDQYKVVTVIPLVPRPKRRTYVMTQTQLDSFLEGYDEYAEYLVSIEALQREVES